jgi:hypothetical protein
VPSGGRAAPPPGGAGAGGGRERALPTRPTRNRPWAGPGASSVYESESAGALAGRHAHAIGKHLRDLGAGSGVPPRSCQSGTPTWVAAPASASMTRRVASLAICALRNQRCRDRVSVGAGTLNHRGRRDSLCPPAVTRLAPRAWPQSTPSSGVAAAGDVAESRRCSHLAGREQIPAWAPCLPSDTVPANAPPTSAGEEQGSTGGGSGPGDRREPSDSSGRRRHAHARAGSLRQPS